MNIEILKQHNSLIKTLRQSMDVEENDESKDDQIAQKDTATLFQMYLEWDGVVGYSDKILSVYNLMKKVAENNDEYMSHSLLSESGLGEKALEDICRNQGFDSVNDQEFKDFVSHLTLRDAFDKFLNYNGIINYSNQYISVLETLDRASV